jgi:hypothetical protein
LDIKQANEIILKKFVASFSKDNEELDKLFKNMKNFMNLSKQAYNQKNWDDHVLYGEKFEKEFDKAITILSKAQNLPGKEEYLSFLKSNKVEI